jgi:PTH1 family peptidyl-tRNA hydrolase
MQLIVALGNPGTKYKNTNHNLGAEILEVFRNNPKMLLGAGFIRKNTFASNIFSLDFEISGEKKSILCYSCPDLMNISGKKVVEVYKKYACSELIVLVDELDLEKNKFKITDGPGSSGHNGIKNLRKYFPKGFFMRRVKLGIGRPTNNLPIHEYVLEKIIGIDFQQLASEVAKPLGDLILSSA